jgi:UDP-2,4-diacetamido-2,4,6-trideoxy-beta-L-altropyranose hydrolase
MKHLEGEPLIIRVDANAQIGTGHLMRCLALAQAWKDDAGRVVFITACQNEELLQLLKEEASTVHVLARPHPDVDDWKQTKRILGAHPDTWVVLDGYHFDEVYQQQVRESGHALLVIDDMAHFQHYYADIVLNQNLHAEQLHYSCEPYTRLLLGTRYVLLRREFLAWKDWRREVPEVARRVLVTLGGADPQNHTLKVVQALQKVDIPNLEGVVVIGAINRHKDVLEAAIRQSSIPIRLVCNEKSMPDLMAWTDVALSTAGTTSWELLFLGVPTAFLVSANNQRRIADEIELEKAGVNLGSTEDLSAHSIAESITSVAEDPDWRASVSERARRLVDGQGSYRAIGALRRDTSYLAPHGKGTSAEWPATRWPENPGLRVIFLGGKQAGCIGLLTLRARGCAITGVVAYDDTVQELATMLGIPTFSSIERPEVKDLLSRGDLLVSMHGREVVPRKLFQLPRLGGINVHPCLYRYKGANPVGRLLRDGCPLASVGVHRMTEDIDEGEVLTEEFVDVAGKQSPEEVYNVLYPYYSLALLRALQVLENSFGQFENHDQ